uniref:Uncharacterized protein n=1 Tax=Macrostomum lignano TaxID=282301 RepID=A0A1I8JMU4_9PLAT
MQFSATKPAGQLTSCADSSR